jgi:hypothetical protein
MEGMEGSKSQLEHDGQDSAAWLMRAPVRNVRMVPAQCCSYQANLDLPAPLPFLPNTHNGWGCHSHFSSLDHLGNGFNLIG